MCNPMLVMAAMQIGSTAMQHKQASMQAKMQTQMHQQNQANAISSLADTYTTNGIRAGQEAQKASEDIVERRRQAMMQHATANVASGEAGVQGITVDRILGNILGNAGRDVSTIQRNQAWGAQQIGRENTAARTNAISRMNSTSPGIKPSGWATAFNIGAAATQAYTGYSARTGETPVEDWWKGRGQGRDAAL